MYEVLPLMIVLFSALEKIVSYYLLRAYTPAKYKEMNPLAFFMTRKVGLARTYAILFLLSILFVWATYEYARYSMPTGMLYLVGELIFFIGVFINNCVWKLLS